MSIKKIAVLTSGGDCGGLNAVVRGTASKAIDYGMECYLIPNGYAGLYNLIDFEELLLLDAPRLDQIPLYLAGSQAGNSRVKVSKIEDKNKYKRIQEGLKKFAIEAPCHFWWR